MQLRTLAPITMCGTVNHLVGWWGIHGYQRALSRANGSSPGWSMLTSPPKSAWAEFLERNFSLASTVRIFCCIALYQHQANCCASSATTTPRNTRNMATKGAKVGDKRKASAVHHNGTDKRVKKAAFEPKRKPFEEADGSDEANDFESFSDEEDGGAKLNDNKAGQKDYKKNDKFEANGKSQADNGKTFERGLINFHFLHAIL